MNVSTRAWTTPWGIFRNAVWVWMGYNVLASLLGWIFGLPDIPNTHARNTDIALGQIVWSNGTIISPPLFVIVIAGLLP